MMTDTNTRWSKYSATYKEYYKNNKQEVLAKNKEWKMTNPEKYLYNSIRQRAKQKGIPFDLSVEDIRIPERCPILDEKLEFGTRYSPSIDRIDNSLGYTKDNIQVISVQANRMKNDATWRELANFCSNMMKTRPDMDDRWKDGKDKQRIDTKQLRREGNEFAAAHGYTDVRPNGSGGGDGGILQSCVQEYSGWCSPTIGPAPQERTW